MRSLSLYMLKLSDVYAMFSLCKCQGCRVAAVAANEPTNYFVTHLATAIRLCEPFQKKPQLRSLRCHFVANLSVQLSVCVMGRMCVRGLVFHRRGDARRKQSEPNDFTTTTTRGEPNRREDAWQHRLFHQSC